MIKRYFGYVLMLALVFTLASCKTETETVPTSDVTAPTEQENTNNKTIPLIFSTQELDKVFNPFYSSSAPDSEVVAYTQISMLGNTKDGDVAYGENEPVVVLDYQETTQGVEDVDQTTTYYFVLKNNVKYSNGSPLTMKDVLFNLYVYLDPVYTGSSTIYSTDIVGLQEYRTQEADEDEQDSFMEQFQIKAEDRIYALADAADQILEDEPYIDLAGFKAALAEFDDEYYQNVVADFDKACELFEEELNTDYSNNIGTAKDISFKDNYDKVYNPFTTDIEAFLYAEGYLTWNKEEAKVEIGYPGTANSLEEIRLVSKEDAIAAILEAKLPSDIIEIIYFWQTSSQLHEFIVNEELSKFYSESDRTYKNISGIKFANKDGAVTVNGVSYDKPTYNEDGSVKEGNEVLSITINGVDPKAIWNFSFAVAPMYYYSSSEYINDFDYVENFGVEYSSQDFQNKVIKNPDKLGVPVGAGPYVASKASGGTSNVASGDFYEKSTIYYEANPHYIMGEPNIKMLRLKVTPSSSTLNALYNSEVDFAAPNAKPETINELKGKDGIDYKTIKTSGYGYIGVNAGHVPDMEVRQAIMHAINTQECVSYYGTLASAVHRSMSTASWAYPKGATPYYPYIGGAVPENLDVVNPYYADYVTGLGKKAGDKLTEAEQEAFIRDLVESAGYVENSNGVYVTQSSTLKYTFTIAGNTDDHPAWTAMYHAAEILNKCGFEITVANDAQALSKLTTGGLAVWAAAWSSTIDPDMYQVYHMDSKATSVNNWGYKQILQNVGGKYDDEVALIEELSELIDEGRKTTDQNVRSQIYAKALDIVMQLAVELPTYQRVDLYAYNINKIDASSLTPEADLTPYNGLTSDIWRLSLNK